MTSTPSVRGEQDRGQAPPGLLIATWGTDETGMQLYAQDDGRLELWRRHGSIPRHLATVTGAGEITWTRLGQEHPQFERDWWASKIWPVLAEHKRATS